ncbi:hypothetical protein OSH04_02105 [Alcaligenes sp. A-TC2]|uniref:hypothetical protein n=1 Tax=Alcaligenes nematophilus TaxID=2994643 RepID=UPI00225861C6|nr:hypothetical protein [Alcaligenes nematophilus]MCX5470503.1 hypothetical protein [Alcaligenes nematophilus]
MQIQRQNFARIGTLTGVFADTCERGYDQFIELNRKIKLLKQSDYDPEYVETERLRDIAGLQTIVFSGMCFESAIYEYAADHLGDAYVKDHLDKLDVLSKWVIVMRLVAGYEFQKELAPYSALKGLVLARNKLVHSKSEPFNFENPQHQINKLVAEGQRLFQSVHNAYRAIPLVSLELESTLGPLSNPLPSFNPEVSLLLEIPKNLQKTIADCRSIISKTKKG